ncbi:Trm112 family protein [Sunxiuqinia dokdonensis]|uniref:Trm112p-like protein n=1 Tax=Sunxiuqinia dokdonensis TaxID=1409788 RepID=A0A0L8VC93_9BACT|nr:Trm112 family protein [Sunxiuqinia dokdonensis]KOH45978.1 hypothetical protein NC99_12230 [Sunxiuqinia dokdonensis]
MKKDLINKLCCPFDKNELELQIFAEDLSEDIREGILICPSCKRYYPIIHGIPIMSPDEYREKELELPIINRWKNQLKTSTVENFRVIEK